MYQLVLRPRRSAPQAHGASQPSLRYLCEIIAKRTAWSFTLPEDTGDE